MKHTITKYIWVVFDHIDYAGWKFFRLLDLIVYAFRYPAARRAWQQKPLKDLSTSEFFALHAFHGGWKISKNANRRYADRVR